MPELLTIDAGASRHEILSKKKIMEKPPISAASRKCRFRGKINAVIKVRLKQRSSNKKDRSVSSEAAAYVDGKLVVVPN